MKTRLGFDSPEVFDELLPIFAKHSLDLLTVHGRTVAEMYRSRSALRFHRARRRGDALPGARQRQRLFRRASARKFWRRPERAD